MSKAFGLLRTNTGLSTNIKIVVDSNYGLFMESIDSLPELSATKFKKVIFNKENYFDEMIPSFYNPTTHIKPSSTLSTLSIPPEIAFSIRYNNDNDTMSNKYEDQYDDIYQMGARNIIDNKDYTEEYEFFAPIYFTKGTFPKYFSIFRVDGPGLIELNKDNFISEIINKLKCIKIIDLTRNTPIGEWIEKNFIKNTLFPSSPLEIDFRSDEFTKWNGIDYAVGGYTDKSAFLDDTMGYENPLFDLEKFIFDGYSKNSIVFPNILNMSFLFDDTPATKTSLRKWSLNRYFGFYLDNIDLVTSISPYLPIKLKSDIYIDSNKIICTSSTYPFDDNKSDANFILQPAYVEYLGTFYKIEQYTETLPVPTITKIPSTTSGVFIENFTNPIIYKYRIVSNIDLSGQESLLNKNICIFDSNNYIIYQKDSSQFDIPDFNLSDVWLINIDGNYHNLIKDANGIKLNTDYGFTFNVDKYNYYINSPDATYNTIVSLIVDVNNPPQTFSIFRVSFTDIKDFDTSITNTEFSKYEYEKIDEITKTDETKMYFPNLDSKSFPNDIDDYTYKGEVVNIPTSSEYTSNLETFRIINNGRVSDLCELWRKNPIHCRWGFQNSLSANDYPYLLNNSDIFEDHNRTANPFISDPSRVERNLDHFYTINSSTSSYSHHSLHVEDNNSDGTINENFRFDIDKYLNLGTYSLGTSSATYSSDYFSYFFGKKSLFENGDIITNTRKYSFLNIGDNDIPNTTLFRGIKFSIFNIDNIKYSSGSLSVINLSNSNTFEDYKFSILLSDNKGTSSNSMDWLIMDEWDSRQTYATNSIVVYDDIIYQTNAQSGPINNIVNNVVVPYSYSNWSAYPIPAGVTYSLLWNPTYSYSNGDIVYNSGEYYTYSSPVTGTVSFWNPYSTGYNISDVVLYKNNFWISQTSSNLIRPSTVGRSRVSDTTYWIQTSGYESSSLWQLISLLDINKLYAIGNYVVQNNIVYVYINSTPSSGNDATNTTYWSRTTSIIPDTNIIYNTDNNPVILMNNKYYLIRSNSTGSTLENGINIYINHKWKNILVNISVNDNTIKNLSETDRDDLYGFSLYQRGKIYSDGLESPVNTKLTAHNLVNCINDITNTYGFTDYLNYIVIGKDGSISPTYSYNSSGLIGLPHMIKCDFPDEFNVRVDSLKYESIVSPMGLLKPNRVLNGGSLDNIEHINYYNKLQPSYQISKKEEFRTNNSIPHRILSNNIHGIINIVYNTMYRHSGYYMPIFYDIDLFERSGITSSIYGNYKFDTTLTNFGIMRQRVISKVNTNNSVLKLSNRKDYKSIYPMLDEFGYTTVDFFIFKSTWDYTYHIECDANINNSNNATDNVVNAIKNNNNKNA